MVLNLDYLKEALFRKSNSRTTFPTKTKVVETFPVLSRPAEQVWSSFRSFPAFIENRRGFCSVLFSIVEFCDGTGIDQSESSRVEGLEQRVCWCHVKVVKTRTEVETQLDPPPGLVHVRFATYTPSLHVFVLILKKR